MCGHRGHDIMWYYRAGCVVMSGCAQARSHHAVHRQTTSAGCLRLLWTTVARTVSVKGLDVLLLETINAYQREHACSHYVPAPINSDTPHKDVHDT